MRPLYETSQDRILQKRFLEEIGEKMGWDISDAPRSYHVEGFAHKNGKPVAVIEVKHRSHKYGDFKTIVLAMLKVRIGMAFSNLLGVPFIFFVKWKNEKEEKWGGFNFDRFNVRDLRIEFEGGRTIQTRDSADVEPVYHLPLYGFELYGAGMTETNVALGYANDDVYEDQPPF